MSTISAPGAATASGPTTTSGKKWKPNKQPKDKTGSQKRAVRRAAVQANPQVGMFNGGPRPNAAGAAGTSGMAQGKFVDALTRQDEAVLSYLETVTNPWGAGGAGVPLVVGGFTLETDPFQMVYEGEAYAGTGGVAVVGVDASGWLSQAGNEFTPMSMFEASASGTQGTPIFASLNSGAGLPNFPNQGSVAGVTLNMVPSAIVEPAWTIGTKMRVVSVGLEVFSDASQNNATGKVMVVSSIAPQAAAGKGGLTGASFTQLVSSPKKLVERAEAPLAGWKSGNVLRAFAIPAQSAAFAMNNVPAVGVNYVQFPMLGAIAIGMATGQSFSWRVTYNYEAIADASNKTNGSTMTTVHAGSDRIGNVLPLLKPFAVQNGPAAHLDATPVSATVLAHEMAVTRPSHAAKLVSGAQSGFLSGVGEIAKTALSKVASGGWLQSIPLVGGFVDGAAKMLSSLWR